MRHGGLERHRIDLEPAAIIRREAAIREVQHIGRAHPSGGVQQHFRPDAAAAFQDGHRPVVIEFDPDDLRSQADGYAAIAQLVEEILLLLHKRL